MVSFALTLTPEVAFQKNAMRQAIFKNLSLTDSGDLEVVLTKRSIDARMSQIKVHLEGSVGTKNEFSNAIKYQKPEKRLAENAKRVLIVGAGPAGLFAALRLIELGIKPIIFERGKEVRERRFDLVSVNRKNLINPDSNYCFGEGGAGTFSDGKLYTRSTKRGDVRRILEIFKVHGAADEILFEAHPHIGTNLLPGIVGAIKETIVAGGGEIHFNSKVVELELEGTLNPSLVKGVKLSSGERIRGEAVMLATGHSARDIYRMLRSQSVLIEAKPFALGVRIEHQQKLIDSIQYRKADRGNHLPAAAYRLVTQTHFGGVQKGVFSFCMCPGGFIVPAVTDAGEIVVNGMSPSRRDSPFSNSGIVVSVDESDFKDFAKEGPLSGMAFQEQIEKRASQVSNAGFSAPAQRLVDFVNRKTSSSLPETSYQPGVVSRDLREVLPADLSSRLAEAFVVFGKKMKGYLTADAQLLGVESRTSSPVRILRNSESFEHPQVSGLFPVAEGAGYAGGIVSAAIDGELSAEAIARKLSIRA